MPHNMGLDTKAINNPTPCSGEPFILYNRESPHVISPGTALHCHACELSLMNKKTEVTEVPEGGNHAKPITPQ